MKVINSLALSRSLLEDLTPFLVHENAPEQSARSFAAQQLRDNITKKLVDDVALDADAKALAKFVSVNDRCESWSLQYERLEDEFLFGHLRDVLQKFVNYKSERAYSSNRYSPVLDCYDHILDHGDLGPGKSLEADMNDFYTKLFASKLSSTSEGLYRVYANYIKRFPDWRVAEETRCSLFGSPSIVVGNRLTFVPKNDEISRVICIEPVLNMFYQQGAKSLLEDRLKSFFGIDLSLQQMKNRELARIGSERHVRTDFSNRSNQLVTIDLSSASDSLSIKMLENVFPSQFMAMLTSFRCPVSQLPNGDSLTLHMISTMGNAFTFPLQTVLFSAVVIAASQVADFPLESPFGERLGEWGVNGDDIICPAVIAGKVLRLLKLLGFEVNSEKTFLEGPFRESCGADFYKGINVRPVFAKKLDSPQDLYSLINRLSLWSHVTGIPLPKTQGLLRRKVPLYEVPPWESADCGIWVPELKDVKRYYLDSNGTISYKRWVPRARRIFIHSESESIIVPRGHKPIRFNPSGLLIAFLKGHIGSGTMERRRKNVLIDRYPVNFITVRSDCVHYSTKVGKAPSWETSPTMINPFKGLSGGSGMENQTCAAVLAA